MGSHLTGTLIALAIVFGLYLAVEVSTGNPIFAQDKLEAQTEDELRELASDFTSPSQVEAIIQLGDRPGDLSKTVPLLAKLTTVSREMTKNAADSSLSAIGAPAAEHLKGFIDADNLQDYLFACSAMRWIGPPSKIYLDDLGRLLDSENIKMKKCALYALQGMGREGIPLMDKIIVCLESTDLNIQCSACRVLETFGKEALPAEKALLKLQKEGGPSTRGWAALCLGMIGPTSSDVDVAVLLINQLKPREDGRPVTPTEKERVLAGLGYLGPEAERVAEDVRKLMSNSNLFVTGHAAFAYWRITGKTDEAFRTIKTLLAEPRYADDAMAIVGKMGPQAVKLMSVVGQALDSSEPGTRELAVVAIGNMGEAASEFITPLTKRLDDTDPLVRLAARRSLGKITPAKDESKETDK